MNRIWGQCELKLASDAGWPAGRHAATRRYGRRNVGPPPPPPGGREGGLWGCRPPNAAGLGARCTGDKNPVPGAEETGPASPGYTWSRHGADKIDRIGLENTGQPENWKDRVQRWNNLDKPEHHRGRPGTGGCGSRYRSETFAASTKMPARQELGARQRPLDATDGRNSTHEGAGRCRLGPSGGVPFGGRGTDGGA